MSNTGFCKRAMAMMLMCTAAALSIVADGYYMVVHQHGLADGWLTDSVDSVVAGVDSIVVNARQQRTAIGIHLIERVAISDGVPDTLTIHWAQGEAEIFNPRKAEGVDATVSSGHVAVVNSSSRAIEIRLSGATSNGSLTVSGSGAAHITLDGLRLTNPGGGALTLSTDNACSITLRHDNTLRDGSQREPSATDSQRACITARGDLTIGGEGQLDIAGNFKHAIYSHGSIDIHTCGITIPAAASDGIRAKQDMSASVCSIAIDSVGGNAMNADDGSFTLSGCDVDLLLTTANTDGLKSDSLLSADGCNIRLRLLADRCKGMKAGSAIRLSGGTLRGEATGGVVVKNGSPSYCTFVKCDGDVAIDGTDIELRHMGSGGKGLSANHDLVFANTRLTAHFACDGAAYIDSEGLTDYYTSRIADADNAMQLRSGRIDILQTGLGGKGIVGGELLEIGELNAASDSTLIINVETAGTAIVNDTIMDERFGCPKAIKGKRQLYVYSGLTHAKTHGMGGEGIECGKYMKMEGGEVVCEAFDDGVNAGKGLKINGGRLLAFSSDNDGIDTNGDITISGGVVVAMNAHFRDEDFDCDEGCDFAINGGTVMGVARDFSRPTKVKQPYIQHTPALWRPDYSGKDSLNVHDFYAGDIVVVARANGYPLISATVLSDTPCAFITASHAAMHEDEDVHIYRAAKQPEGAESILGGRVFIGGDRMEGTPLITLPATKKLLGATTEDRQK